MTHSHVGLTYNELIATGQALREADPHSVEDNTDQSGAETHA